MKCIHYYTFLLFICLPLSGKSPWPVNHPNTELLKTALQRVSSHGNELYFGSARDFIYHDGIEWKTLAKQSITAPIAFDIDSDGKIWVGGDSDLGFIDESKTFHSLKQHLPLGYSSYFLNVFATKHGIYFAAQKEIFVWDGESLVNILQDRNDSFFMAILNRLEGDNLLLQIRFKEASSKFYSLSISGLEFLFTNPVKAAVSDIAWHSNKFILATNGEGLFELKDNSMNSLNLPELPQSITCFRIINDTWVLGTISEKLHPGITIYSAKTSNILRLTEKTGLPSNTVFDLHHDGNKMWAATLSGSVSFDPETPFTSMDLKNAILLCKDDTNTYVSTTNTVFRNGVHYRSLDSPPDHMLIENGKLVVMNNQGILIDNPDEGEWLKNPGYAYRNNTVVQKSSDKNTYYFSGFDNLTTLEFDEHFRRLSHRSFDNTTVYGVAEDENGWLWLSTYKSPSLIRLKLNSEKNLNGHLEKYDRKKHLNSEWVQVVSINKIPIFLTDTGIFTFDESSKSFAQSGILQGKIGNARIPNPAITNNGVWLVLEKAERRNQFGSEFAIGKLTLNNKRLDWNELYIPSLNELGVIRTVVLDNQELLVIGVNNILKVDLKRSALETLDIKPKIRMSSIEERGKRFDFGVPNDSPNIQYLSTLENFDNEWKLHTETTAQDYSNLPVGKYTFKVKVLDEFDRESSVSSIYFAIEPHYYETKAFWIITTISAILIVICINRLIYDVKVRLRIRKIEQRAGIEIVAKISHELRNYASMNLAIATRNQANPTPEGCSRQVNAAKKLSRTIETLLDYQKFLSGSEFEKEEIELNELYSNMLENNKSSALQKGLEIFAEPLPKTYIKDELIKLEMILTNLITNAIKYTEKGSIKIITRMDKHRAILEIKVIDTGIGIPKNLHKMIFSHFFQVSKNAVGLGVGLALARGQAEAINGKLYLEESTPSKGSTFVLRFKTQFIEKDEIA